MTPIEARELMDRLVAEAIDKATKQQAIDGYFVSHYQENGVAVCVEGGGFWIKPDIPKKFWKIREDGVWRLVSEDDVMEFLTGGQLGILEGCK